ncbi:MAG TPA: CPXCG motif-containing cysteine-rich protein [Verrucomicrobiae bacterium]|nr:CPXCG motif-containing cysteine-rich protein [Verrucomicrobiae bacterium]
MSIANCALAGRDYLFLMEELVDVQCPFCGQSFEIVVDTSVTNQRFTTDCEVCCRPFEVVAECETGEILSLAVSGN